MKKTGSTSSRSSRSSAPKAPSALDCEPRPLTLVGRTALVTGSSKGLGKAMAFALGAAGAKVALNFEHGKDAAVETFAELTDRGYEGGLFQADVTQEKDKVVGYFVVIPRTTIKSDAADLSHGMTYDALRSQFKVPVYDADTHALIAMLSS